VNHLVECVLYKIKYVTIFIVTMHGYCTKVWGNTHITVLPRAPTQLLEFQPRLHHQDATVSSNSAQDQASLVSTTSVQRANSFVFSAVTATAACSVKITK
jgi:hypothetical protein